MATNNNKGQGLDSELVVKDYYEDLDVNSKEIAAKLEGLLHGISIAEVNKITSRLKDKMMNESKANLAQSLQ